MNESLENNSVEEQEPRRSPRYMGFLVLLMSIISLLDNTLSLIDTRVVTYMEADFGFAPDSGLVQGWIGIYGVFAFGVWIITWLTDALGRKKGLIILVLVMGVPAVLLPFVTPDGEAGLHPSMILYAIITLGTIANTWELPITEESPVKRRGLYGALVFMVGMIPIYALTAERIVEAFGSWKWVYAILGGSLLVPSLVLLFFMKETKLWQRSKEELKHKPLDVVKSLKKIGRKDWKYIGLMTGVYISWGIAFKYAGLAAFQFLTGPRGQLTTDIYDLWLTIAGICLVLGAVLSTVMMHKLSRRSALIVGCIGSTVSFILIGITASPVFMATLYFFMPIILSYITVYFAEVFPTEIRATCFGTAVTISRSSYVIGPGLAALVIMLIGASHWLYWVIGGIIVGAALLVLLFKPVETRNKTLSKILEER